MAAFNLNGMVQCLCDGGRLMVGVPNYDTYLRHVQAQHPDRLPMNEVEFFRDRQRARYGEGARGGFRCC
jgi:uncharacterized short protein YbdD (DUF466 family)